MWRIGIDEAGRGPVIGPLVVGALRVSEADLAKMHEVGITDSKLLSPEKRVELDAWIRQQGWDFELHVSNPPEIDRAMMATNLNDHEVSLFAALARKLRVEGEGILQLDACDSDASRFGNNVASRIDWPWHGWTMDSRHAADLHCLAVAGASILAKVERDRIIRELGESLGIDIGSGYPSDPKTVSALPALLEGDTPHDCLRWKWKTVSDAWHAQYSTKVPQRPPGPQSAQRTLF
jgi:ribonuclease HII